MPKIAVIVRKTYGMAFWNMCGSGCGADFLAAWPTAEMSFVDPAIAVNVVFGGKKTGPKPGIPGMAGHDAKNGRRRLAL